ncbi:tRNA1(Val) (adenine(37)-N6)-methyltransferase [[Eubacterium] hominis]|uniref:tRNA1(Val) (adenine(37)-N6)-methyltransferase n=1 Tax=[Eubacterium] hominis TaxID=2764325 RepID=UPI003A4D4559
MAYTYDYLNGTDIYLYQDDQMFRMNSDTARLAAFMKIHTSDTVLDIGTNNGALLAAAARKNPSKLIGIEIQHDAVVLAKHNMEQLHIDADIIEGDVSKLVMPKVTVVVCNPPYFQHYEGTAKNESEAMRIARHEVHLTLDTLAKKVSQALQEKGRFYLVHRSNRLIDIVTTLRAWRLETRTIQFIYDENKEEAIGVLIEAIKDGKANCHILPPITHTRG